MSSIPAVNGPVPLAASTAVSKSLASAAPTKTSNASAASTGANITSNDFLTLLVSEMKNQDPTQPTDPNAYIQQLVGVNSLQQLIAINGDLTGLGATATPPAAGASAS